MLGEHGEETHMFFIYQSALHVPLIIKLPGSAESGKIDDLVGLIDIVPTVCEKMDIRIPSEMQGQSLCSYFSHKSTASQDRHLYCESLYPTMYQANSLLVIVTNRWKYIQTTRPEIKRSRQPRVPGCSFTSWMPIAWENYCTAPFPKYWAAEDLPARIGCCTKMTLFGLEGPI